MTIYNVSLFLKKCIDSILRNAASGIQAQQKTKKRSSSDKKNRRIALITKHTLLPPYIYCIGKNKTESIAHTKKAPPSSVYQNETKRKPFDCINQYNQRALLL